MKQSFPSIPAAAPLLGAALVMAACVTKAPLPELPPEEPAPVVPALSLGFDRIEAGSPGDITLFFLLNAENPRPSRADISLAGWGLSLNGQGVEGGAALTLETAALDAFSAGAFPVRLSLGSAALSLPEPPGFTEYDAGITLDLVMTFRDGSVIPLQLASRAVFPRIQPPVFTITSIAVMQAELINTRFKVSLRIDNPNPFPVELSAFAYELYGSGRYWAGGKETKVMDIPPEGSAEKELFLLMNFINMRREVLDQVIALRTVRYRFTGEVLVGTGIEYLPRFTLRFDQSGESSVVQ